MALIRSLSAGTSSLRAHQQRLDVISNNIANVNTIGFKGSRTTFAEQFSQTFGSGSSPSNIAAGGIGGVDPVQIGLGVRLGAIKLDLNQGSIQNTTRALDLALQGDGFFVFKQNGQTLYSRAGAFSVDSRGNLVDSSSGSYVQGYNLETDSSGRVFKDSSGTNQLNRKVTNVEISPTFKSAPRQTQSVQITGNLRGDANTGDEFNTSITIYDTQGAPRVLNLAFTKTAPNTFGLVATMDSNATPIAGAPTSIS
jgi:flagellar hook protein FlgE